MRGRAALRDGLLAQLVVPRLVAVDLAQPVRGAALCQPRRGRGRPDVDRVSRHVRRRVRGGHPSRSLLLRAVLGDGLAEELRLVRRRAPATVDEELDAVGCRAARRGLTQGAEQRRGIVVVGGAITKSADATAATAEIRRAVDERVCIETTLYKRAGAADIRTVLEQVSTANISDAWHRQPSLPGIRPLLPGAHMCGPAVTVRTYAGDWAKPVEAIDACQPGDVLVIDACDATPAMWGELATAPWSRAWPDWSSGARSATPPRWPTSASPPSAARQRQRRRAQGLRRDRLSSRSPAEQCRRRLDRRRRRRRDGPPQGAGRGARQPRYGRARKGEPHARRDRRRQDARRGRLPAEVGEGALTG